MSGHVIYANPILQDIIIMDDIATCRIQKQRNKKESKR
jgi:hypothetical protein